MAPSLRAARSVGAEGGRVSFRIALLRAEGVVECPAAPEAEAHSNETASTTAEHLQPRLDEPIRIRSPLAVDAAGAIAAVKLATTVAPPREPLELTIRA